MKEGSWVAVVVPLQVSQCSVRKAWLEQRTRLSGQRDRCASMWVGFNPQVPVKAGCIRAHTHAHNLSSHKRIPGAYGPGGPAKRASSRYSKRACLRKRGEIN